MRGGTLLIENVRVLDVETGAVGEAGELLIVDGRIRSTGSGLAAPEGVDRLDARGGVVTPGFFDCHVHLLSISTDLVALDDISPQYATAKAVHTMQGMLSRGFTTVRDVGGADHGLAEAAAEGLVAGPRVLFGGKAISQTGGHGDMRPRGRAAIEGHACHAGIGLVCDGVAEVRRGVRSMLRLGADHVKLMLSGGVASPTDRIDSTQYSDEEVSAAVEEARAANRYVAAHAYTPQAINRALDLGVRTIEHGNLLDESCIAHFIDSGAYYVPTIIATTSYLDEGGMSGLRPEVAAKVEDVARRGLEALRIAHEGGVSIAFGTDLLGDVQSRQLEEFELRARVQGAAEVIRSATAVSADAVARGHELGRIAPGYIADLNLFVSNPADDISVVTGGPLAVVQAGRVTHRA